MSQRRPQYFIEIGGRVRGNEQHFFSGINQPNRRGACQRGFADAPFAGEEQVASGMIEKLHGTPLAASRMRRTGTLARLCFGGEGGQECPSYRLNVLWSLSRSGRKNRNTRSRH